MIKTNFRQIEHSPPSTWWQSLGAWSLLSCALMLYLFTLDNGFHPEELRGGDLITHQYAQVQARPSNAPGYPLYTMGGWLWFHGWHSLLRTLSGPYPNPIQILSSYSTLWALVSLWFFYQIVVQLANRWQTPQSLTAILLPWLLSAFYAVTYFFWFYATTTEQYTSAIAQTLAIVYVYLNFQSSVISHQSSVIGEQTTDHRPPFTKWPQSGTTDHRLLFLLAFLSGLSLAHMLTVAFIVPPLVVVILWQAPWLLRDWRAVVGAIVAAALPLLSYVYIYWRGAAHPEWWGEGEWATPSEWFWSFISTAQGRDELARGFQDWCGRWAGGFPEGIWHELSLPILLVGLVGILFLGKRLATLLYGTLIIYLIFCWMYRCGNWFQVILPAYPLILLGIVPVVRRYESWIGEQSWRNLGRQGLIAVPYLLLVLAIVWRVDASWPQVDSRNRSIDTAFDGVAHLLNDAIPFGTALFATVDDALALQYLNQIWGIRPDIEIVDHKEARRRLDNGQFVLTTHASTQQLLGEMREGVDIGLWSVTPDLVALQVVEHIDNDAYGDPQVILNQVVEEGVELVGYTIAPMQTSPVLQVDKEPALDLLLYWHLSQHPWPQGLSISVRPTQGGAFLPLSSVDENAPPEAIIQQDETRPMRGLEPVSHLLPEYPFPDAYRLPVPSLDAADGIAVILYRAEGDGFRNVADIRFGVEFR